MGRTPLSDIAAPASPLRMGRSGLAMSGGARVIQDNVLEILLTPIGSRRMRPSFGCDVHALHFEPMDADLAVRIEERVRSALRRWEPRVHVQGVETAATDNTLSITVTYKVLATGQVDSVNALIERTN